MNDPTMYDEDTRLVVALGDYPRDPNGQTTGFFNAGNGTWGEEQSWDGRRLIGNYYSGYTYFLHSSGVGSSSPTQITDGSGGPRGNETYYPYGQEWNYVNQVSNYWQYFGGYSRYEWDIGLYLTPHRSYSPLYGRWLTPDKLGGDVTNPQSLNRYAYVLNNPATLTDPLGLDPYDGNPGDPCSDPTYADSHARCGWSPCWGLTPEAWSQSNCSGLPAGIGGGGIGSMLPPVPPAGQPPLAGGGTMGNQWVSETVPWNCSGGDALYLGNCFLIIVQTSALSYPRTPFEYHGVVIGRSTNTVLVNPSKDVQFPQPPLPPWKRNDMIGSCALNPDLWPPLKGNDTAHPDPGVDAERSVPRPHDPLAEGTMFLFQTLGNAGRCVAEGRIPQ